MVTHPLWKFFSNDGHYESHVHTFKTMDESNVAAVFLRIYCQK